jgi:hypothetical protein
MSRAPAQQLDTVVGGRMMRIVIGGASVGFAGTDPAGLLWFVGTRLTAPYTPQMAAAGATQQVAHSLEVFDPGAGHRLASVPFETRVRFLAGTNLAYSVASDSDGVPTYTVWRMTVVQRQQVRLSRQRKWTTTLLARAGALKEHRWAG